MSVILWGTVWWEPRQGRSEKGERQRWAAWALELGLTYEEGFIKHLPLEYVKCESLQFLCLDLFQPNGLQHLGGLKAVLRAGIGSHER